MSETKELARFLKVLSVDSRVKILELLKEGPLCVGALSVRLGITQGAVSQHLRIMRDAGILIDDKDGYYVHYRINKNTLEALRDKVDVLLEIGDFKSGPPRRCRDV